LKRVPFENLETGVLNASGRWGTVEHMFDTTGVVSPRDADVARLQAGVSGLSSQAMDGWHSDTVSDRLVSLLELRERIDAEVTRVAAVWSCRRAWEADGALSPTAWIAHRAPVSRRDARRIAKTARLIDRVPQLADALAIGATTAAHVAALAAVMPPRRETVLVEHGELLAKQAEKLSIKDFTLLARRWASLADDELAADNHPEAEPPRNELRAGVTTGGRLVGDFDVDTISGTEFLGLLDHMEPPDPVDGPEPPRSLAQRRGDAWQAACIAIPVTNARLIIDNLWGPSVG
jgi:hypothetical protein